MTYSHERLDRIEAQKKANTQTIAALAEQLTVTKQQHDWRMTEIDQRLARLTQLAKSSAHQTLGNEARITVRKGSS